ncbi:MAG: YebC/PmpR family DNA-binding transcriptional regulator [Candidatus Absconditabacteria bacterium]
MAGHSKRHNIKHKKAASDAKKAKVYTKVGKIIEMAARGGADPSLNPNLEAALQKARYNNLPREVIDRAIKKGSGQVSGDELQEVYYEGYGPGGTALYVKAIASNTNRAGATIRAMLTKMGGNMGEPGSVSWQFNENGVIYINGMIEKKKDKGKEIEIFHTFDLGKFEEDVMDIDVMDYEEIAEGVKVITSKSSFLQARKYFEGKSYKIEDADIEFIPENYIDLSDADEAKLEKLIDMLEEEDDVDTVYHNAN